MIAKPDQYFPILARIGVGDTVGLDVYRRRYVEGIPRRSVQDEAADAKALYHILADVGGRELVGSARELAPGTFYMTGSRE